MTDQEDIATLLPDGTSRYQVEGLSVKEAADVLGLSEKTVRNRIHAGTLPAVKVARPQGYEWRVFPAGLPPDLAASNGVVPDPSHVEGQVEGQVVPDSTAPPNDLARLLEQMYADNQRLADMNAQLAGQVGFLQARVQEQERQIALLMAPKDEPAPPIAQTPATDDARSAPEPAPRRSLWARVVRRLAGEP